MLVVQSLMVALDAAAALADFFVFTTDARDGYAGLVGSLDAASPDARFATCVAATELYEPVPVTSATNCLTPAWVEASGALSSSSAALGVLPLLIATAAAAVLVLQTVRAL